MTQKRYDLPGQRTLFPLIGGVKWLKEEPSE